MFYNRLIFHIKKSERIVRRSFPSIKNFEIQNIIVFSYKNPLINFTFSVELSHLRDNLQKNEYYLDEDSKNKSIKTLLEENQLEEALQKLDIIQEEVIERDHIKVPHLGVYILLFKLLGEFEELKAPLSHYVTKYLKQMEYFNIPQTVSLYNSIINSFGRKKDFENMIKYFDLMQKKKILPDNTTFTIMINWLEKEGEIELLLLLLQKMRFYEIKPDHITLTVIMKAFGKNGKLDKMMEIFEMTEKVTQGDIFTYNTILTALSFNGDLKKMELFFQRVFSSNIEPDVVTFNILIQAFSKVGDEFRMNKYYRKMLDLKITPNNITLRTLLNGYSKTENTDKMISVYNTISSCVSLENSPEILNPFILAFAKKGDIDSMLSYYEDMRKSKNEPDEVTFLGLLIGFSKVGNIKTMLQYFELMITKYNIIPKESHLNCIIRTFSNLGKTEETLKYYNGFKILRIKPSISTLSHVTHVLKKETTAEKMISIFEDIVSWEILSNELLKSIEISIEHNLSNILVSGNLLSAIHLIEKMIELKFTISRRIYYEFLTKFVKNFPLHHKKIQAKRMIDRFFGDLSSSEIIKFIQNLEKEKQVD